MYFQVQQFLLSLSPGDPQRGPPFHGEGPRHAAADGGEQLLLAGRGRAHRAAVPRGQGGQPAEVQLQAQEQDVLRDGGREGEGRRDRLRQRICDVSAKHSFDL